MRTRIAPTPSGFLHVGNLVNFLIVAKIAEERDAHVLLRIDDLDQDRVRSRYIDDIFRCLAWLGIAWDEGPRSSVDVAAWSQLSRLDMYIAARDRLLDKPDDFYVCTCSRKRFSAADSCRCEGSPDSLQPGHSSLRMRTEHHGCPVIWRRDGLPAYHLSSVVDDTFFNVDVIVRGDDLRESTEIQRLLAGHLTESTFPQATVLHHDVVSDANGAKLSKSAGASGAPLDLTPELRMSVHSWTNQLRIS